MEVVMMYIMILAKMWQKVRDSSQHILNSGFGIIVFCRDDDIHLELRPISSRTTKSRRKTWRLIRKSQVLIVLTVLEAVSPGTPGRRLLDV